MGRALPGSARRVERAASIQESQPLAVRLLDDTAPCRAPAAGGLVGLKETCGLLRCSPPLPVNFRLVLDEGAERSRHAGFPPGLRLLRQRVGTAARFSGQDLMIALRGDPGLLASVEAPGRVEVPMPQVLADDADAVGVLPEVQLGCEVPELVRRDPDADMATCSLGNGRGQDLRSTWPPLLSGTWPPLLSGKSQTSPCPHQR